MGKTVIYRWGSCSNANLTPRERDTTGLSFSLTKPGKGKYVVSTIEAVNSTDQLIAINDHANHVSVFPSDMSEMPEWIESRPNAKNNPHKLTELLKSVTSEGRE